MSDLQNKSIKHAGQEHISRNVVMCCSILAHIGIGYSMTCIGPAMNLISNTYSLGSAQRGLLGASALVGNIIGSFSGGKLADQVGRKKVLVLAWLLSLFAGFLSVGAFAYWVIVIARVLIGATTGAHYAGLTAYVSEVVKSSFVDKALIMIELNFFVGTFLAFGVGYICSIALSSHENIAWRVILGVYIIPIATAIYIIQFYLPESPIYKNSRIVEESEVSTVATAVPEYTHTLKDREVIKSIVFVSAFWIANSLPAYGVGTFAISMFDSMNLALPSDVLTTIMGLLGVFGVVLGVYSLKAFGKRYSLVISQAIAATTLLFIAMLNNYGDMTNKIYQAFIIIAFCVFNAGNNLVAPLCMIYPAKIFPSSVKGSASGISGTICRIFLVLGMFAMSYSMDYLSTQWTIIFLSIIIYTLCFMCYSLSISDDELDKRHSNYSQANQMTEIQV